MKKIGAIILGSIRWLNYVGYCTAAGLVALLTFTVVYNVLARYVFRWSTIWPTEVSVYILVSIVMLPFGALLEMDNGHVRVSMLVDRLSERRRKLMRGITSVFVFFFSLCITYYSARFFWMSFKQQWVSESLLRFPLWIPFVMIPLGGGLLSLTALSNVATCLRVALSKKVSKEENLGSTKSDLG